MDHAIAIKGMISITRPVNGVRSVAEIGSYEVSGYFTFDGQTGLREF
jgi:hypothetical protein